MHTTQQRIARCMRTVICTGHTSGARITLAIAWFALGMFGPARRAVAQDAPLKLGDAYRALETRGPRVAAARAMATAADAAVRPAARLPDPQVQLGLMNYGLPSLAPMPPLGMLQLQVMQMLPLAGKRTLAREAASARAASEHARADATLWTDRAAVASAFYDLYQVDARLTITRQTLSLLGDLEQTTQAMYRVGTAEQSDVLRAQVELARMSEDTLRLDAQREAAGAELDALLGVAADSVGRSVRAVPALPVFPATVPSRDSLLAVALRARPAIRAGQFTVRAAQRDQELAERNRWPDLELGVQLGRQPGAGDVMGSLMIGAALPVFSRGRMDERQGAQAMAAASNADLRMAEAETRSAVLSAYADLLRARHLAELYRTTIVPQARANATSALASYTVGRVDFAAVLDARMAEYRVAQELHQMDADQGVAWARLEALVAHPLLNPDSTVARAPGGAQ